MPSLGRKFLMAGRGGLNLTHSEPFEKFLDRYGSRREQIAPFLKDFTPEDVRRWAQDLGIETFVGTSGRVFPMGMKTSPLLRRWLARLDSLGVIFHLRHAWRGWTAAGELHFETPEGKKIVRVRAVLLALGGGSWPRLGSTGEWVEWLREAGARVEVLKPSNCGFDAAWSEHFRARHQGHPLKSVILSFQNFRQQGEFIITEHGVEGSLIYAASARLREALETGTPAIIHLDLAPGKTQAQLLQKLSRPRGSRSLSSHLERTVGIRDVKAGLLREFLTREELEDPARLASGIKDVSIPLLSARPLEEAISSAGGVSFEALDEHLMVRALPGVFCAGEMLDWEAPTGGYLLTACFATGRAAARGILAWLAQSPI
jgi:uncharacterized flavoprotein (TIGR03862 family)